MQIRSAEDILAKDASKNTSVPVKSPNGDELVLLVLATGPSNGHLVFLVI